MQHEQGNYSSIILTVQNASLNEVHCIFKSLPMPLKRSFHHVKTLM